VLPDAVKKYIVYFRSQILAKSVSDIEYLYEFGHKKLSDRFFNENCWPSADVIAPLVDHDHLFLLLYKELYYRHIYASKNKLLSPTVKQRIESFNNYKELFTYFLESKDACHHELPDRWLWDMIDEFIYQFQSYTQFRSKLDKRPDEESVIVRDNLRAWNVFIVLNTLQLLIDKSKIKSYPTNAGVFQYCGSCPASYAVRRLSLGTQQLGCC
jgi:translation initiation factor 3 subunit L